jgi:hypothetical protein
MLMKKVAVTFVALVAAVSAHAQMSSEGNIGGIGIGNATYYDVVFQLNTPVTGLPGDYSGGGTIHFSLTEAADLSFNTSAGTPFTIGYLSGPGLIGFVPISYGLGTTGPILLSTGGPYTYTTEGLSQLTPSNLQVDIHAVSAIPEPQTYGMLLAGLAVIGISLRRRRMPVVSRSLAMS